MKTAFALLASLCFLGTATFAADQPKSKAASRKAPKLPSPTLADVHYGASPKQVLHFWKAESKAPAPLLFYIHGGGWTGGDRASVGGLLPTMLKAGISVVSVEYRFVPEAQAAGVKPPVEWPLHDAARALQFVRSKAAEWHVDKKRIGAAGGSAGACTSLWLAFHPDMAELRDKMRTILQKYLPAARMSLEERWGKAAVETREDGGEHAPVTNALKDADKTMPKGPAGVETPDQEVQRILDELAKDVIGDNEEKEKDREDYLEAIKALPFVIESVSFPGTNFIDVQYIGNQIIIRVNTRHKFYREMWAPMREMANSNPSEVSGVDAVKIARRTQEALTLMVAAYAKAESMHDNPHDQYGELRNYWGQFLDSLLGKVKNVL
jgi:hypothetical protein